MNEASSGRTPIKRGVGAGRSAQRGTSGAATGPRGARSAPPNPEPDMGRSAPDPYLCKSKILSLSTIVAEGELLWEPSESFKERSLMAEYIRWLAKHNGQNFETYEELWRWSVTELEAFWASIVEFFDVNLIKPPTHILTERRMPGTKWFQGAVLNYTQNIFRHASPDSPALVFQSETRPLAEMSWAELQTQVSSVAAAL